MITAGYRDLNRTLHENNPKYGSRGDRHADTVRRVSWDYGCYSLLDYGTGKGSLVRALSDLDIQGYDPAVPAYQTEPERADFVSCTDVLEHIEPDELHSVLDHIRGRMIRAGYLVICTQRDGSKTLPDGRDPHLIVKPLQWWAQTLGRYFWIDGQSLERGRDAVFTVRPRHPLVTVALWKWGSEYTAEHVNTMVRMVGRNLSLAHRVVCITDDPAGVECDTIPLWPDTARLPGRKLNCFRRLRAFAADAHEWLGERILSLDLDGVITGDITPLVDIPESFRIWADPISSGQRKTPYNGGMWLLSAGARRQVWDDFDPATSPHEGGRRGYIGTDQAWIGACLGTDEATWDKSDGVYSYRIDLRRSGLPENARIAWFHGEPKPWQVRDGWVHEHWR